MRRFLFPLTVGLIGAAILLALGTWQMQRLAWKERLLADIAGKISAAPVALPANPDPVADRFLPVTVEGRIVGAPLRVLTGRQVLGAGYKVISALDVAGRRVLIDRGFLPDGKPLPPTPEGEVVVTGNLHWPDETDSFTPAPEGDLWFARDVPAMAKVLGTEPVLIVASKIDPREPALDPMPVDTAGIPNDHLEYAITWFSLAAIWMGMTGYWVWRNRARTDEADD